MPIALLFTWLLRSQSPPLPDSPAYLALSCTWLTPPRATCCPQLHHHRVLLTNRLFLAQHLPELNAHRLRCLLSTALIKCHFPEAHVSLISGTHITFCPVAQTGTLQVTPESSLPVPPVANVLPTATLLAPPSHSRTPSLPTKHCCRADFPHDSHSTPFKVSCSTAQDRDGLSHAARSQAILMVVRARSTFLPMPTLGDKSPSPLH